MLTGNQAVFGHFGDDGVGAGLGTTAVFKVEIPLGKCKAFGFFTKRELQVDFSAGLVRS